MSYPGSKLRRGRVQEDGNVSPTLTYAIIRGFTESCEDEELKENLKEQMREALEMNFDTAFKMSDGETFEEASRSMEEAVLKAMTERWKS